MTKCLNGCGELKDIVEGPSDSSIKAMSQILAKTYADGWRQHAAHVGEMRSSLTSEEWAFANAHEFAQEALEALEIMKAAKS